MANTDKSVTSTKRSPILDDFFNEVKQGFLGTTVKVGKFAFVLELADEDAEVWADQFIRPSTPMAFVSARRAPRLATAVKAVGRGDTTPVALADLFQYPDAMTADQRKTLDENPVSKQYWLWGQMMAFLASLPAPAVERLYTEYDALLSRRDVALKEALESPNSSAGTPGSN